ncbi:MAG: SsgA family sporulation/cell division regulator [Nocardioides sp.]
MEIQGTVAPLPVVTSLTMELFAPVGAVVTVDVELSYDPADPFAVAADFDPTGERIRWTFARDLLRRGLFEPSGDGDVRLSPSTDADGEETVILQLCSPDGESALQTPAVAVAAFLEATSRVVPFGTESSFLDIDALVARILASTRA